jgi:hypothetical protein
VKGRARMLAGRKHFRDGPHLRQSVPLVALAAAKERV